MRLLAVLGMLLAVGAWSAASTLRPQGTAATERQAARRARAAKICAAQGPTCHVVERPGQPRDNAGIGCVCDAPKGK